MSIVILSIVPWSIACELISTHELPVLDEDY